MSFSMHKLRSLLPGTSSSHGQWAVAQRHSVSLEPEVGFQITIEMNTTTSAAAAAANGLLGDEKLIGDSSGCADSGVVAAYQKATVPELNVHLIAARHLPALFGFKVVQGYMIKVKLFPGSKRLDSSIQTNSWPKFNENFKFPLAPDIKPSLKHSSRRTSKTTPSICADLSSSAYTPEELFAGQFVVFTVYALLELPPASFNRLNKTYRSLRDKSSNFVQKVVEGSSSNGGARDDRENAGEPQKMKRKAHDSNPRDAMPPLTISESRRNIGSVTCYLEPKLFKRNGRTGCFSTEELWLPIKDLTTTVAKGPSNSLANAAKGVVEIVLEVSDVNERIEDATSEMNGNKGPPRGHQNGQHNGTAASQRGTPAAQPTSTSSANPPNAAVKNPQWNRMTSEVKRKMGISNNSKNHPHDLVLRITTARMRCSNKVKDELESTAGSVYVKTTVFEHGIYIDCWKSAHFYPSLSTKWDVNNAATIKIPLQSVDALDNILIRTTLATKTKMGKKFVLGTVMVGARTAGSGIEHMQLLRESPLNERVPMWHSYQ